MAMIDSHDLSRVGDVFSQHIFRGKLEVDSRIKDIAERVCLFNIPVPIFIYISQEESTCFNELAFMDIYEHRFLGANTDRDGRFTMFSHTLSKNAFYSLRDFNAYSILPYASSFCCNNHCNYF